MNEEPNQPNEPTYEDYQQEYYVPQNPQKPQVKNDFALSEKLIKIEWNEHHPAYYPNVLPDLAKSNLSPLTYAAVNKIAMAGIQASFVGEQLKIDLTPFQNMLSEANAIKINAARAKGGWAGFLSKTNKSVSEEFLTQKAMEIQQADQPKKSLMQKIFRR